MADRPRGGRDCSYVYEDFTGEVSKWIRWCLCPCLCRGKCADLIGIKQGKFKPELSKEISVLSWLMGTDWRSRVRWWMCCALIKQILWGASGLALLREKGKSRIISTRSGLLIKLKRRLRWKMEFPRHYKAFRVLIQDSQMEVTLLWIFMLSTRNEATQTVENVEQLRTKSVGKLRLWSAMCMEETGAKITEICHTGMSFYTWYQKLL